MGPRILIAALLVAGSLGFGHSARAEEDPINMQTAGYDKFPAGAKFHIRPTFLPTLIDPQLSGAENVRIGDHCCGTIPASSSRTPSR